LDSATDLLILKKIELSDLNLQTNEFQKGLNSLNESNSSKIAKKDDFKARIYAFIFKNIKTKKLQFTPVGVNFDEESIPNWKIFLVLMDYIKDSSLPSSSNNNIDKVPSEHKLLKVCFPDDDGKNIFAIVVNFDKSCLEYVNFANSFFLLSNEENQQMNGFKVYKKHLINENNLQQQTNKRFINNRNSKVTGNKHGSFIEKSQNIIEDDTNNNLENTNSNLENNQLNKKSIKEKESGKPISFDNLVNKFTVEELNKIKSLIKFAKKNKIMQDIYVKKGDINIHDLVKARSPKINNSDPNLFINAIQKSEIFYF